MYNKQLSGTKEAFKFAVIYLIIGLSWIILSDLGLSRLFDSLESVVMGSMIKGLLFIVTTAAIFFFILKKIFSKYSNTLNELEERRYFNEQMLNSIPGAIFIYDIRHKRYLYISKGIYELADYTPSQIYKMSETDYEGLITAEDWESYNLLLTKRLANLRDNEVFINSLKLTTKYNLKRWIKIYEVVYKRDKDNIPVQMLGVMEDITPSVLQEENIKRAEYEIQKMTTAVEQSEASIVITDTDSVMEYVNKKTEELSGYKKEELIGKRSNIFSSGEMPDNIYDELWSELKQGKNWTGELLNKKKNGELYWERIIISPLKNVNGDITNYLAIKEDITEKKEFEKKLIDSLREKEVMLKEIHHRVKNNLQIIRSLLKIQSEKTDNKEIKLIYNSTITRIKSISIVHDLLYRFDDLSSINFDKYVTKLIDHLYKTYNVNNELVEYHLDIEPVILSIETAIPCGLILNEIISNSFKHAFPDGSGIIDIRLKRLKEMEYMLEVSDNGKGINKDMEYDKGKMGMNLINALILQLDGKLDVSNNSGTYYKITFRDQPYKKRFE